MTKAKKIYISGSGNPTDPIFYPPTLFFFIGFRKKKFQRDVTAAKKIVGESTTIFVFGKNQYGGRAKSLDALDISLYKASVASC